MEQILGIEGDGQYDAYHSERGFGGGVWPKSLRKAFLRCRGRPNACCVLLEPGSSGEESTGRHLSALFGSFGRMVLLAGLIEELVAPPGNG